MCSNMVYVFTKYDMYVFNIYGSVFKYRMHVFTNYGMYVLKYGMYVFTKYGNVSKYGMYWMCLIYTVCMC